ncbi:MAG: hypothetical protein ACLR0U_03690 [Enterocloster clostridioformis]
MMPDYFGTEGTRIHLLPDPLSGKKADLMPHAVGYKFDDVADFGHKPRAERSAYAAHGEPRFHIPEEVVKQAHPFHAGYVPHAVWLT